MRTSKKAMDLFLRDLEVAIETELRDYRTQQYAEGNGPAVKSYLAGLECARNLADMAIERTETHVPTNFMRFLEVLDREATARALAKLKRDEYIKRETRPTGKTFVEPSRPNDQQIFEQITEMFYECALTGAFPEPRLSTE